MKKAELIGEPMDMTLYEERKYATDAKEVIRDEFIKQRFPTLDNIEDDDVREATITMMSERINRCFYEKPSSSTGKYHPDDENQFGGLVLHVRRVMQNIEVMLDCHAPGNGGDNTMTDYQADLLRSAAHLHDGWKYGSKPEHSGPYTQQTHPKLGRDAILQARRKTNIWKGVDKEDVEHIAKIVETHHGTWKKGGVRHPEHLDEWIMHHADLIASRPFMEVNIDYER